MMKCLFIGGSHAGKMIEVDIRQSHVYLPVRPSCPAHFSHDAGHPIVDEVVKSEIYKFDVMTDREGNRHIAYVEQSSGCPLAQLMAFYAGGGHSKAKE